MQLQSLKDLFVEQLRDLYSAETQLVEALPKLASAASHDELRQAFEHHLEETRGHVDRLREIFEQLGTTPGGETCKARKKPKCDSERTPLAAPNIMAALISRSATGSVHTGESLST